MWLCCQIGAREHYAIPRVLHRQARLSHLYTDFWAGQALRRAAEIGDGRWKLGGLRSLASRYHHELAGAAVTSWNVSAFSLQLSAFKSVGGSYCGFIEVGSRFAVRVREALKRRIDLNSSSIFFAYDTGALEAMEWCHGRAIKCVLNQMDPNRVEVELVHEEEKLWPGWTTQSVEVPDEYFRRREQEWALADRVVVNSEFCRLSLVKQGVPPEKLVVVPLAYEGNAEQPKEESRKQKWDDTSPYFLSKAERESLRVLFLGQVILRKGIQYLIQAARQLEKENLHFDVVGQIGISQDAIASAPRNMTFHGRATRDQAKDWYRQADLFVLPTLSDGFALTQLEAMAYGLPVITTSWCGDVVSDGIDGFIVPPRDAETLAKTIERYLMEPELLRSQQAAALEKAKQFTLDRLAGNLLELETALD